MNDILKVTIFSLSAYVYLFIIAKLLGKKQIAQLSFIDYVVGITIGSIAAEMATETEQPFYHFLIAMGIFFLFDLLVTIIGRKSASLKKLVNGKPLFLISDGTIQYETLVKSGLSFNELSAMARAKGFFDVADIAYAVFETSGELSIMPKSHQKPLVASDMNLTPPKPTLIEYVVVDGKISKDSLQAIEHDKDWLLRGLKIAHEDELENILVASYDSVNQNFKVQYKQENKNDTK